MSNTLLSKPASLYVAGSITLESLTATSSVSIWNIGSGVGYGWLIGVSGGEAAYQGEKSDEPWCSRSGSRGVWHYQQRPMA